MPSQGTPSTGGGEGGGSAVTSACSVGPSAPGPSELRRLTNAEYRAAVTALLGLDASDVVALFPADLKRTGFDNGAELQTVSVNHADQYHSAALTLSGRVFADAARRAAVLGCEPTAAACLRSFVTGFGRRAFRRAVTNDEVERYLALAAVEPLPLDGAQLVLRAFLESPNFLWRPELGVSVAGSANLRLTGLELATRLSFFLWGAPPDEALLAAGEGGALDTVEGLEATARAMLADARAQASFGRFAEQWFGIDKLAGLSRSAALFPGFDEGLKASMREELRQRFAAALWTPGAPMLSLYASPRGAVDARLAALYGVSPAPAAGQWQSVDWSGNADRGGLFTTSGLLTATARNDFTSPIQRGLFIREAALCEEIQLPPGGVPPISAMPGESAAEAESRHTSDPACTGCHLRIDPVGLGLERYDALGVLRAQYPNGKAVPLRGKILGLPAPDYAGGVEMGALLAQSDQAARCAVQHTFRWALGRFEDQANVDACTLERLGGRFAQSGQSFTELVAALVTSPAFRERRPPD